MKKLESYYSNFIYQLFKTNKILNGLLVGASIGAGFAVFETAGYILNSGLQSVDSLSAMTDVIVLRGWSSLGDT